MSELCLEEDPCPSGEYDPLIKDHFLYVCNVLDRQCDHLDDDATSGLWRGVDVSGVDIAELPHLLGNEEEPYDGPFMRFCKKAVMKQGYRRLGDTHDLLNLRLKIVGPATNQPSITILLQKEYAGYDISIEHNQVILSRLGAGPEVLSGSEGEEVIDDIHYVASRLLYAAYHSAPISSKIQVCDSLVPSATSKELAIKPKRNFGMRALKLFKI